MVVMIGLLCTIWVPKLVLGPLDDPRSNTSLYCVFFSGGAVITERPKNMTVEEGQGLELPCRGEANPGNLSISWLHEGVPVGRIGSLDHRVTVKSSGALVFAKVVAGDEGEYTCQVTNGIGKPITASAYLAVECKLTLK